MFSLLRSYFKQTIKINISGKTLRPHKLYIFVILRIFANMFRALYDYKTDMKQYLSFVTGDQFTVLDSSQKDWYFAQNGFGEIGYIPKNYVVKDQVCLTVLKFLPYISVQNVTCISSAYWDDQFYRLTFDKCHPPYP